MCEINLGNKAVSSLQVVELNAAVVTTMLFYFLHKSILKSVHLCPTIFARLFKEPFRLHTNWFSQNIFTIGHSEQISIPAISLVKLFY